MHISRVKPPHALLFAVAIAVSALTLGEPSAWAQNDSNATGAPRPLSDEQPANAPSPPADAQAAPPGTRDGTQPTVDTTLAPAQPPDSGVVVNSLGNVEGPAVGLIDDSNGGLGAQMWSGASRSQLEDLLARIPIATTDPVVRDLSRRLLLSAAEAPAGQAHRALITIRVERLLDAGLIDEAGALAALTQVPNDADFARVQADALLYAERAADVCSDKTASRLSDAEPFWLELRAYCEAASGNTAAADLTRSVMDAQGISDPAFQILLGDAATGGKAQPGPIDRPTAIHVFLLRKLRMPITAALAAKLGTPGDVLCARDVRNPPADRLLAAERVVDTGALSNEELISMADLENFSAEQKAHAAAQARSLSFLARQALFRQAAALESRPGARLEIIKRGDPGLNEPGSFAVFSTFELKNVASLAPYNTAGELGWIAARVLVAGGKPQVASGWLKGPLNPLTADAGLAIDLAAPDPEHDAASLGDLDWLATHAATPDGWPAGSELGLGLWSALGEPTAPNVAAQTATLAGQHFDGEHLPDDIIRKIDNASADPNRRGEAILRIVDAIGAKGPGRLAPDAVVGLVAALQKLGLSESARKLAIEALILGPPRPPKPPSVPTPSKP